MCGFLVASRDFCTKTSFSSSLNLLHHRGPDETKILSYDAYRFGFKRLSIQDLTEAGSQPMKDEKGNVLCFNGEIYNFHEIRRKLSQRGVQFKSKSDTEVLLRALDVFGVAKALTMLDGMYAVAYFQEASSKMMLFRDPFGMKPLFYHIDGHHLLCASEIKALLPLIKTININQHASLNPLLFNGMSSQNDTLFDDVKNLPPGTLLEFDAASKTSSSSVFCDLKSFVEEKEFRENSKLTRFELTEKFGSLLRSSVNSHLVSDAPVAVLYSAGLDSSLIATLVSEANTEDKTLFKYQADGINKDHSIASEFADRLNFNLQTTKNIDSKLISQMPYLIYAYETVNKADGLPLNWVCKDARDCGYKVMLTGDSADELWGGYGSLSAYRTHQYFNQSSIFNNTLDVIGKVLPGIRNSTIESLHHLVSPFDIAFVKPFLDFGLFKFGREGEWLKCRDSYDFIDDQRNRNINAFLLDELSSRLGRFMIRSDRIGMAASMELRLPFLTKGSARLAVNVPYQKKSLVRPSLKRRTMFWDKAPLRDFAQRTGVGSSIIQRPKVGTPSGQIEFDNLMHAFRALGCKHLGMLYDIKQTDIIKYIEDIRHHALTYRLVWNFLSMEIFLRLFVENTPPSVIEEEINSAFRK